MKKGSLIPTMSNKRSEQHYLQDQTRGYTEEDSEDAQSVGNYLKTSRTVANSYEQDIAEDRKDAQSMYEYFMKTHRPGAKSYGHDIIEESAFASIINYPAEGNDAENELEKNDVDNRVMVDQDPQHKIFMDHLRPDGISYVLDIFNENAFVKYHKEPSSPEPEALTLFAIENTNHVSNAATVLDTVIHTSANNMIKRRGRKLKCPNADKNGSGSSDSHLFAIKNANPALYAAVKVDTEMHTRAKNEGKRRGRKPKFPKHDAKSGNSIGSCVASEAQKLAGKHTVKCRGRPKGVSKLHASTNPNGNSNHVTSGMDMHEQAGRRRSKRAKRNVIPLAEGQAICNEIKEENEDNDYNTPRRRMRLHIPVQLNVEIFCDDNNDEANSRKETEYKKSLMKELSKPYCQEEYERLWKDISDRKLAQGEKVLRGCTKSYKKDHASLSYLDHHIDLERKIKSACDDHSKVLNLMRGFFYWLINSPQEKSFKPWRVFLKSYHGIN